MFCRKCGNQIADGSAFCAKCGASMSAGVQTARAEPVAQPVDPAQPPKAVRKEKKPAGAIIVGAVALVLLVSVAALFATGRLAFVREPASSSEGHPAASPQASEDSAFDPRASFAFSQFHAVGLTPDGRAVSVGQNRQGENDVAQWKDLCQVTAGGYDSRKMFTVGLKTDGTALATGYNAEGQCDVSEWADIVEISAGDSFVAGLNGDGTVVTTFGLNADPGQEYVSDWTDVVSISAGAAHLAGVKSDGTVVAAGNNDSRQCEVQSSGWNDIVGVSAGRSHTVAVRADGTVVATGSNDYGQCNVSDWMDIVAVSAGSFHTIGFKSDGTVVSTEIVSDVDRNVHAQGQDNVRAWRDVTAVFAGHHQTLALQSDGTLLITQGGENGGVVTGNDVDGWALRVE